MIKLFCNSEGQFVRTFSDWDQIRDLVNSQLPSKHIIRMEKLRGSDTGKSYKVVPVYKGDKKGKPIEVPINGKSALENYNKATGSKVENTSKIKASDKYSPGEVAKRKLDKGTADTKDLERLLIDPLAKERKPGQPFSPSPRQMKILQDWYDRLERMAGDSNTPKEILEKLTNIDNHLARAKVARHPNVPKELLEKLANDESANVRWGVAENPNTPKEVLEKLSNDKDWGIREAAQKRLKSMNSKDSDKSPNSISNKVLKELID